METKIALVKELKEELDQLCARIQEAQKTLVDDQAHGKSGSHEALHLLNRLKDESHEMAETIAAMRIALEDGYDNSAEQAKSLDAAQRRLAVIQNSYAKAVEMLGHG